MTNYDNLPDRFSLLELDDPTDKTANPFADDEPTVETGTFIPPEKPIPGKTIIEGARAKAADERALVQSIAGLEIGANDGLLYSEGTAMLNPEQAIYDRQSWDRLPLASKAAERHAAQIAAEQRKDYPVDLSSVVVDSGGHLTRANGGLRFTEHSYRQLQAKAPRSAPVKANLNSWLSRSGAKAVLRTRNPHTQSGTRELYAAVSPKYTPVDSDRLLAEVAASLPADTRARIEYDPNTTRLIADLSQHNPYEAPDEIAVGRLHRVGVRLSTDDRGTAKLKQEIYIERIRCINCTKVPFSVAGIERKHIGNVEDFLASIAEFNAMAGEIMAQFSEHWHAARVAQIMDGASESNARERFEQLADAGLVHAPGIRSNELVDRLVNAWSIEPGTSYQSINRAITRAAQSWSPWVADELETQAGELLWQQVSVVNNLGW